MKTSDPSPELEKLLRLKRHEQPPEGYFDDFVHAFHQRQRAELLRVSAWRLAVDRVGAFFHHWRFLAQPRWLYPLGAAYALLMIALFFRQTKPTSSEELAAAREKHAAGSLVTSAPGVIPLPTERQRASLPPGAVPVSLNAASLPGEAPNGLRRTVNDAFVPVLPPDRAGTPPASSPEAASSDAQVIILVR